MHSVRITYFDASQLWNLFEQNLSGFLPLKSVGKSTAGKKAAASSLPTSPSPAPMSFPQVNASFIPYSSSDLSIGHELFELHKRPLVHLFLASCEDIDVYRADVRPKLISWLESMPNRRSLKLIVILIEKNAFSVDTNKSSKAFLADKIKFDFGDKATLNVVSLKHQSDGVLTGVAECVELISSCNFASASSQLEFLDEEIRKIDSQRLVPGWNYCKFFIAKEEKALLNLSLGLVIDALLAYEELEATYHQMQDVFKFDAVLPPREHISGQDLFAIEDKPYREMIHRNEVCAYDFGVYLFSCQALILGSLKKYSDFLTKTKKFVCAFTSLEAVSKHQRDLWIFDSIISACRFLYSNDPKSVDSFNAELSDLLLLAESMITSAETEVDEKMVDASLDFSNLPYYAELEKFYNLAGFKASILNWCRIKLDKNCSNGVIALLRIAHLYYDVKLFQNCVQACDDLLACLDKVSWQRLRIQAYELAYKAHKQLGSDAKFVEFAIEYLRLCTEASYDYQEALENIQIGILNICQDVSLELNKFFAIEDVSLNQNNDVIILLSTLVDVSSIPLILKASFSGEQSDLHLDSESLKLSFNESNQVILPLKDISSATGTFKLKSVSVFAGKVEWKGDVFASGQFEITLTPFNNISFSCSLPVQFDFNKPEIRVSANFSIALKDFHLSAYCSDFSLSDSKITDLSDSSSAEFNLVASRFIPGKHKIKLSATYTTLDSQVFNVHVWQVITFPQPWSIEAKMIKLEQSMFVSLKICPFITQPLQFKTISIDECSQVQFRHTITSSSSTPIHFSAPVQRTPEFVTIFFETPLNDVSSYKIRLNSAENKTISAFCRLSTGKESTVVGEILRCQAGVDDSNPIPFELDYDQDCWMISGPCSGLIKGTLEFDLIPIKTGALILPTLQFPQDKDRIHNQNLGSLIHCVDK